MARVQGSLRLGDFGEALFVILRVLFDSLLYLTEEAAVKLFFGNSVATGGDVNGDGYSDVIIGAWLYDNGQTDEGRAFLYLGSGAGLSAGAASEGLQSTETAISGWWFGQTKRSIQFN